jgi:putative ABC transport system ATP-binding protein
MSLKIRDLLKSHQQSEVKIEILKNLSADLNANQVTAIIGQSGSGKSTLLSLLAGLEKADQGTISIHETNISALAESEMTNFRAKNISIVFQQYHLISHLTALENVILPLEILGQTLKAEQKATSLLSELGLAHRLSHKPNQLSGGEAQRVAIARALIVEPKLILADEPSGNLDLETGKKVMDLFFEMVKRKKIMTVVVTHSESVAKQCDRILKLQDGKLLEVF